jgi:hypothetical protein
MVTGSTLQEDIAATTRQSVGAGLKMWLGRRFENAEGF